MNCITELKALWYKYCFSCDITLGISLYTFSLRPDDLSQPAGLVVQTCRSQRSLPRRVAVMVSNASSSCSCSFL